MKIFIKFFLNLLKSYLIFPLTLLTEKLEAIIFDGLYFVNLTTAFEAGKNPTIERKIKKLAISIFNVFKI